MEFENTEDFSGEPYFKFYANWVFALAELSDAEVAKTSGNHPYAMSGGAAYEFMRRDFQAQFKGSGEAN